MFIITGGSGFFGQHLIKNLSEHGFEIKNLDILNPVEKTAGVKFISADVRDKEAMEREISAGDIVIHNAALVPLTRDDRGFLEVNVEGTRHVLEASAKAGVKKFIFISSSSVYGIPPNGGPIDENTPFSPFEAYGKSKVEAESICEEYKNRLDISILRPRTIIGPGRMGILSLVFDWVARSRPVVILGNGSNRYQLLSACDLAEAVRLAATLPCRNENFNVGTANFGTLNSDLGDFFRMVLSRSKVYHFPAGLARAILPVLSALRLVPFVAYQYNVADKNIFFSMDKMKKFFGWVPTQSNSEMLASAFEFYKNNPSSETGSIHSRSLKKGLLKLLG